jgi:DNA-binding GntR family transcriptional regulator
VTARTTTGGRITTGRLAPLSSPVTLRAATVDHLRDAIITGELPPGCLLRETDLAARLGISGTPVREALSELAAEGLVEIEPNRLKRVAPLDLGELIDMLKVQCVVWEMGYRWAFPKIGEAELIMLRGIRDDIERACTLGTPLTAMNAIHEFHGTLMQISGNKELVRLTVVRRATIARFVITRAAHMLRADTAEIYGLIIRAIEQGQFSTYAGIFQDMSTRLITFATQMEELR